VLADEPDEVALVPLIGIARIVLVAGAAREEHPVVVLAFAHRAVAVATDSEARRARRAARPLPKGVLAALELLAAAIAASADSCGEVDGPDVNESRSAHGITCSCT
jgi:hypothetical protein